LAGPHHTESRCATVGLLYGGPMPTLIFVHGACVRDADWWWSGMVDPLIHRGITTAAVALPSCGETGAELGDLHDDVAACRAAIAKADGPVVLLGHSYGGVIITEAGADDRVAGLLYVTSVMPDAGQSQADLIGSEPAPWLDTGETARSASTWPSFASSSSRTATSRRPRRPWPG